MRSRTAHIFWTIIAYLCVALVVTGLTCYFFYILFAVSLISPLH